MGMADDRRTCLVVSTWAGRWRKTETDPKTNRLGGIDVKIAARKWLFALVGSWVLLPASFLIMGRSLGWWQAWVWCAVLLVPMTVFGVWKARTDPDFIDRRLKMREKERPQQRLGAIGFPFHAAALALPGFDHRYGWSEVPMAAVIAALALSLAGFLLVLRVFAENRWAGRTVQTWEGQQVVSTGPYAIVRHPMYTGALVLWLATPIALGSWWALLPALASIPFLMMRVRNEEEVLRRDLNGYEEYLRQVRYRLLPLVW
jgi:protein-S-isoprenylcysteine O-methyltransferase Ste14